MNLKAKAIAENMAVTRMVLGLVDDKSIVAMSEMLAHTEACAIQSVHR